MRGIHVPVMIVGIVCGVQALSAQAAQKQSCAFQVGATRERIIAACGKPRFYAAHGTRYQTDPLELGIIAAKEIYERRTKENTYEAVLTYKVDTNENREHRTQKLDSVTFQLGKISTADSALADIAETSAICAAGCAILARENPRRQVMMPFLLNSAQHLHLQLGSLVDTNGNIFGIFKGEPLDKLRVATVTIRKHNESEDQSGGVVGLGVWSPAH